MTSIFHSGLSKDLSLILNDADDFNVIIQVGENRNVKEFRAHSVILRARSLYFKSAFSADWIIKKNNMIMFNKPNITPVVFDMILKYIYTGELDLTKQLGEDILGLLVASDELLIEELFNHVQDYLIEKQSIWVQQNFVFVLHTVFRLASCKKLQDYCLESICKNPQLFITSKSFTSLDRDILFGLLERDDFQIEVVAVWDSLINWGIKQTSGLEEDEYNWDEWTDKNYEDLRNTLSDFIPLINFLKITSEDFHHKIRPYKAIIPSNIYEELMTYYLVEQPKLYKQYSQIIIPQIESNIIKPILANVIANWVDKKNAMLIRTEKDPLYEFNIIYRGSHDGINTNSFKSKCKGQVASLVLVKVQNSNKIFGGYSSIGLNSIGNNRLRIDHDYGLKLYHSSDNFIFSFENDEDIQNMKISRVVNYSKAILDHITNGFNFGRGSLSMCNQNLYVYNYYCNYENSLRTDTDYIIEEIETYVVVKH